MKLTEAFLRVQSLPQVFERGLKAHQRGWEGKIEKHGSVFIAEMKGGNFYHLIINLQSEEVETNCSCPYDQKGWCKHLITMGLGIIDHRFNEIAEQLDPELARNLDLVNIDRIRDEFSIDNFPFYEAQINSYAEEDNFRNAMRVLLGIYEGFQSRYLENSITAIPSEKIRELLTHLSNKLFASTTGARQEVAALTPIFQRWDKYEQALDLNFPGKSIRYDLNIFEDFMMKLSRNSSVSSQFLRMRIDGYSLSKELLPRLREGIY